MRPRSFCSSSPALALGLAAAGWALTPLISSSTVQPQTVFATEEREVTFTADTGKTWLEVNGGTTAQLSRRSVLYLNLSYQRDINGRGHAHSGKLCARFNW